MDNNFSIFWNPTTGEFKVFDSGPFWSVINSLKPLCISLCDDGFIEFQFYLERSGDDVGIS